MHPDLHVAGHSDQLRPPGCRILDPDVAGHAAGAEILPGHVHAHLAGGRVQQTLGPHPPHLDIARGGADVAICRIRDHHVTAGRLHHRSAEHLIQAYVAGRGAHLGPPGDAGGQGAGRLGLHPHPGTCGRGDVHGERGLPAVPGRVGIHDQGRGFSARPVLTQVHPDPFGRVLDGMVRPGVAAVGVVMTASTRADELRLGSADHVVQEPKRVGRAGNHVDRAGGHVGEVDPDGAGGVADLDRDRFGGQESVH